MMRNSRGQSAMEYLMTYGWALILIVVVIVGLYYIMPKQSSICTGLTNNMTITSYDLNSTGITFQIANGSGKSVTLTNATATGITVGTPIYPTTAVAAGDKATVVLPATLSGDVAADITVTYNESGGITGKTANGRCSGKV